MSAEKPGSESWAEVAGLCKAEAKQATDPATAAKWTAAGELAEVASAAAEQVETFRALLTEALAALAAAEAEATAAWRVVGAKTET